MANYTFRIHPGEASNAQGWNKTRGLDDTKDGIFGIPDSLDTVACTGKIGTSIPTPLARIYLFRTAFKVLAEEKDVNPSSPYSQLVSDCLDLLQLLFEKGNDPLFKYTVCHWTDIDALKQQNVIAGHKLLGESLAMAMSNDQCFFKQDICLIEYDGVLLGGTSPFTLVYTSPNAKRLVDEMRSKGKTFVSNKGYEYFGAHPCGLDKRPSDFKEYLLGLRQHQAYSLFFSAGRSFQDFGAYILKYTNGVSVPDNDVFDINFPQIKGFPVNYGVPICVNDKPLDLSSSHFLMRPTSQAYRDAGIKSIPLFLPSEFNNQGWVYVDTPYDIRTQIPDRAVKFSSIKDRQLIVNGKSNGELMSSKYPWVSNEDLFYDNIYDLGYELNTDKFFSNANTANRFLLPIRNEYFLFFTVDDLKNNLRIEVDQNASRETVNSVTVSLTIPLASTRMQITVSRTYTSDGRYKIISDRRTFSMGVFPFYKLEERNGLKNEYSIYLFDANKDRQLCDMEFYTDRKPMDPIAAKKTIRTDQIAGKSIVYNLRSHRSELASNSFDFIRVHINEDSTGGIIIPLFKEVASSVLERERFTTVFAIDFGTSNTHIAYLDPQDNKVKPFDIRKDEQQMVLLHKPITDNEGVTDYRNTTEISPVMFMGEYLREFAPALVGNASLNSVRPVQYPVKTASLENSSAIASVEEDNQLFSSVNIGYDIETEQTKFDDKDFHYETNLKWALQDKRIMGGLASKRVNAYCEQTMWMLKNKIVNSGWYAKNCRLVYFVPESMKLMDKKAFDDAWSRAIDKVFTNCGFVMVKDAAELEGVAPYYSLLKRDTAIYTYNSVNIDIGGGTTDIFILDKNYMEDGTPTCYGYEASVLFAGSNIWGTKWNQEKSGENGFVNYMKKMIDDPQTTVSGKLKRIYEDFSRKDFAEDLSTFFFKHEGFGYADKIKNNSNLRFVLFMHLASIIWYVKDIILQIRVTNPGFQMPSRFTFTGKGSEYLKILAPDEQSLTNLTYGLLCAFGFDSAEFETNGIRVSCVENPKCLTAEGGVYKYSSDPSIRLDFVKKTNARSAPTGTGGGLQRRRTYYENIGTEVIGIKNDNYKYKDIPSLADKARSVYTEFVNRIFDDPMIKDFLSDIEIYLDDNYRSKVLEYCKMSYDIHSKRLIDDESNQPGDALADNLFFMSMKDMLIELSLFFTNNN